MLAKREVRKLTCTSSSTMGLADLTYLWNDISYNSCFPSFLPTLPLYCVLFGANGKGRSLTARPPNRYINQFAGNREGRTAKKVFPPSIAAAFISAFFPSQIYGPIFHNKESPKCRSLLFFFYVALRRIEKRRRKRKPNIGFLIALILCQCCPSLFSRWGVGCILFLFLWSICQWGKVYTYIHSAIIFLLPEAELETDRWMEPS